MTADAPLPSIPERRYERPPIVEALCEIYFTGSRWDATTPGIFYERVRSEYPQKSQMALVGVGLQAGAPSSGARPIPVEPRMRFARGDNSRLLQLGRDLLVVNQLLPYPRYEDWRDGVHASLAVYRELTEPTSITHLGVRYINHINVPASAVRMEEYFRVYLQIPQELGDAHGSFMLQMLMFPICSGHQLTLTLGSISSGKPDDSRFLLDLYDVVQQSGRDGIGEVGRLIDEAHANIVHTFENVITSEARHLFGEIKNE